MLATDSQEQCTNPRGQKINQTTFLGQAPTVSSSRGASGLTFRVDCSEPACPSLAPILLLAFTLPLEFTEATEQGSSLTSKQFPSGCLAGPMLYTRRVQGPTSQQPRRSPLLPPLCELHSQDPQEQLSRLNHRIQTWAGQYEQ
jgi:hypothetical protein